MCDLHDLVVLASTCIELKLVPLVQGGLNRDVAEGDK